MTWDSFLPMAAFLDNTPSWLAVICVGSFSIAALVYFMRLKSVLSVLPLHRFGFTTVHTIPLVGLLSSILFLSVALHCLFFSWTALSAGISIILLLSITQVRVLTNLVSYLKSPSWRAAFVLHFKLRDLPRTDRQEAVYQEVLSRFGASNLYPGYVRVEDYEKSLSSK